jgi:hypothetical protein
MKAMANLVENYDLAGLVCSHAALKNIGFYWPHADSQVLPALRRPTWDSAGQSPVKSA